VAGRLRRGPIVTHPMTNEASSDSMQLLGVPLSAETSRLRVITRVSISTGQHQRTTVPSTPRIRDLSSVLVRLY
jgi:hypothetical protein